MPRRPLRFTTATAALTAALLLAGLLAAAATTQASAAPPLRVLGQRHGLPIGTAVGASQLQSDATYRSTLSREFSSITAESEMKWKSIEPARGQYTWAPADQLVAFAQANGQRVYGHTLVWYKGQPAWLEEQAASGELDGAELRQLLRDHITRTVTRYGTKVWAWDVVNEALNEDGTLRDNVWLRALGPGYIADSFRWARAANPRAKLFINDYNVEWVGTKSTALLNLVRDLEAQGVPVDGVAFQTHRLNPLPQDYQQNLQRFADLGVDVAVSELDNRILLPVTDQKLATQADTFERAAQACLAVSRCVSFTLWGFTDKYSWVPGTFPGYGAAHPYDESFVPKPAYAALVEALS